jgi:hypothetical protein
MKVCLVIVIIFFINYLNSKYIYAVGEENTSNGYNGYSVKVNTETGSCQVLKKLMNVSPNPYDPQFSEDNHIQTNKDMYLNLGNTLIKFRMAFSRGLSKSNNPSYL